MKTFYLLLCAGAVLGINSDEIKLAADYFSFKNLTYLCYFSCDTQLSNVEVAKQFILLNVRTSVKQINKGFDTKIEKTLLQRTVDVGVLLDGSCENSASILQQASKEILFDSTHVWLVLTHEEKDATKFIEEHFQTSDLSYNADVVIVNRNAEGYTLTDVFNFGKIQGNDLEITPFGTWQPDRGLILSMKGSKFYKRWNFNGLTLRAVSVILNGSKVFHPDMLSDVGYSARVAVMTKISSQFLIILKEQHNFRLNYTVVDRWIGSPERNSVSAISNTLFWKEQDISSTCARVFPVWLNWVGVCFPPTTKLQTKFYYLMPDSGVGDYENRFLTPMSMGVWWCTLAACVLCAVVLALAARLERRPKPGWYAFFSVTAVIFQQDFKDGAHQDETFLSQGRKMTLLVVGLTSMLLYNYYTSSVVSWLLSAVAPSIDSLDQLINSNLELVFEDIGYTRSWFDNPGFFYYRGKVDPKEDELRDKKVIKAKRTVKLFQPLSTGIELIRNGPYAYHTEPYSASQQISKTFTEAELCELGSFQMIIPANVYIMVQKRSPYKEFFNWSLMRLSERGHFQAIRHRFSGMIPRCSGIRPRALTLGEAAPAFLILLQFTLLSVIILMAEIIWHRIHTRPYQFVH